MRLVATCEWTARSAGHGSPATTYQDIGSIVINAAATTLPTPLTVARAETWFWQRGWQIFDFQREAWSAYARGESGLIHAPTGTGKTYAAWFAALIAHAESGGACAAPLTVLWITPLRALAVDTLATLGAPLHQLGVNWTVGLRTGDTNAAERRRQMRRLPSALITTPESLSLLLSYRQTAGQFRQLSAVVVDEWHELMGTKRGVQLQLCLSHLRGLQPRLRTWGLSATIGNLAHATAVLTPGTARVITGQVSKAVRIRGICPANIQRFPWAGHMGMHMLSDVVAELECAATSLIFTNTRAQAERWFEALTQARPDWIGQIALHHGSLDQTIRRQVEQLLRNAKLRCVVATSTLDLGVDFSPVERVLHIGSPKGVARLLQRAGRSGHRPGALSEVVCVPTQALELVEIAAARRAATAGIIEPRHAPTLCLDVLCQHLVTLALASDINPASVFEDVRETHAYAELSEDQRRWVIDFVTRGGPALKAYPQFRRLVWHGTRLRAANRRIARLHRMAIGTITSGASLRVQFQRGGFLGMIEESFVSRLRKGDRFLFAGKTLELVRIKDMVVQVKSAAASKPSVPRWYGGRMPLSTALADALQVEFEHIRHGDALAPEVRTVMPIIDVQMRRSHLPCKGELLVERTRAREGYSLFVYPFAGRLVHEGLAALVAWRLSRHQPMTVSFAVNDYGFELLSRDRLPIDEQRLKTLFAATDLRADILNAINASEMSRRQFRDIARIAGLVFQGYPGAQKSTRQIQASSGLIFDVLADYDADNELLAQAEREVLTAQFDLTRLRTTLQRIKSSRWICKDIPRLSPLGFPLWADRTRARLSSETWQTRVEKMQQSLNDTLADVTRRPRARAQHG